MKKKIIILIDGNYCLYQTYFSYLKLKNKNGDSTGILYGCIKIFNRLIEIFNPKNIVIIFDTSKTTFRHQLYNKYKKHRKPMPSNLKQQIKPLKKIIQLLGIPIINIKNVEADDIIGSLSKKFTKKKYYVFIYSADKDLTQLVDKKVSIIPGNFITEVLNEKHVYKKYGVHAKCIADFLGLTGDSSDNIPGVPGIGKKTASALLKNFSSISDIYKNINRVVHLPIRNIKNITSSLEKNKKTAFLSYRLTKINQNIYIKDISSHLKKNKIDTPLLLKYFKYYQFNKYIEQIYTNQFPILDKYHKKKKNVQIEIVNTDVILKMINIIIQKKIFSIAIDFYINKEKKTFFYISISVTNYITWWYIYDQRKNNKCMITPNIILKKIKFILENENYHKIGTDLKKIFHTLKKFDITLTGIYFDTSIALYYYQLSNNKKKYKKNTLKKNITKKNIFNSKKIIFNVIQKSLNPIQKYFQNIKYLTINSKKSFRSIDIPLIEVLSTMEHTGVLIKKKILKKQKKKINNTSLKLSNKIYSITQEKFNINSPKQLQKILFKKYNFPYFKKTKTGNISTDETVLSELSKIHKLPKIILQYRILKKLKNTYLKKLMQSINGKTKRIHTTYHQDSTSTGRLSSSNPNLQNIPIKTKTGRKLRIAFIAKKKWLLLTADYSHIELRIMAHYSNDKKMIKDLSYTQDIHYNSAKYIFNINDNKIKSYHRNIAKIVNFSILYGISSFGLSQKLNIPICKAREYIKNYFSTYKTIKEYIKYTYNFAKKKEYVKTLFGRKIYIPNINSKNQKLKNNAKRFCINVIIQNTASDIIKTSMIKLQHIFQKKYPNDIKIIMQIHDELIFEIKEEQISKFSHLIKYHMENSTKLIVPLYVSIKTGKNWKEMKSCILSVPK
ncbi:DNA polymerase I [Buchnera aphidicola]|uniref:DNA polymerase I n=1 Tax=Buchnera aphidicola (Cinara cf. splendens/pseudotsugae 3390) TaxID=2518980 RepID=A0A451CWX5_9GAMM|nr:DNA polymerase I [Buchnera aphidicola]VFP77850.1 DNA polymerase I [Buchnera aphidicola (Cinara cf. splendens/pseudotsugae 3390)]